MEPNLHHQNAKKATQETSMSDSFGSDSFEKISPKLVVLLGCLSILASAVFFYISTVYIRWAKAEVAIDASFFVFFRFMLGFFIICGILGVRKKRLEPRRYDLLIGRTVFNCIAVFCFYRAIEVTSLAEGNILNMTYPIFLAVLSWILLKEQRDHVAILMVGVAFVGIWLILSPGKIQPDVKNLWGLMSGMSASAAILYLNVSRRYHDTETILFYMFGLGSVIMYLMFHERIFIPDATEFHYLLLCALFGVGGQYLLTIGFLDMLRLWKARSFHPHVF